MPKFRRFLIIPISLLILVASVSATDSIRTSSALADADISVTAFGAVDDDYTGSNPITEDQTLIIPDGGTDLSMPLEGRFIRIQNNGLTNRALAIGEIEAFASTIAAAAALTSFDGSNDLALSSKGATVETATVGGGHGVSTATIDGSEQTGAATWTVTAVGAHIIIDLGGTFDVKRVRAHHRNDGCCQHRLMDFDAALFADDGAGNIGDIVASGSHPGQPASSSSGEITLAPVTSLEARFVRIQNNGGHLEFFENKVRPLLVDKCYRCHSAKAEEKGKLKAGLHLDSLAGLLKGGDSGSALTPGDPAKSFLVEAVNYRNEDMEMPPKGKLSDAQIKVVTDWVQMGAPWPGAETATAIAPTEPKQAYDWNRFRREHWSFKAMTKAEPPQVTNSSWPRSPIDHFTLAKLETAGLQPNNAAEKRTLIRRAYLDLIGLPPTTEQVEAFLNDSESNAFAKVVDGLLSSEHYGERWARHWLDVARYSDGLGGFGDTRALPDAWRYRDWVVNALNTDMPYDEFVARQIAGDVREKDPDPIATGFFVVGPSYSSDGGDPEAKAQAEAETLSDRVDTFSRAFLGLTAACARCHDHKFDPITTQDYYAIAGIFKNTRNGEHPLVPQAVVEAFKQGQEAIKNQNNAVNRFLDDETKRLKVKRNEVEKSLEEGPKKKVIEMRAELERLKKTAPKKYEIAHVLQDAGKNDMHVALRGDLRKKGELVPRRFIQILAGETPPLYTHGSGRRELAQSVIAPDNPLTARVIVNRVWHWHFGKALVRTPSNFGILGEKPTHPQLLDWLATDFVEHGWSLKRLHRQIMLTSTWQMSSRFDKEKFAIDGDNKLLWRMNSRRLEAEVWRDSLLAVTGELDRTIGGKPDQEILRTKRRTLYATISRTGDKFESDAFLRLFDFPAAVATSAFRPTSTVPQQYLFMLNSPFMTERAKALGNHLHGLQEPQQDRIKKVYQQLYSRSPDPAETELGRQWLGDNPAPETWHQYAQVLLSAHELIQIQ